MIESLGAIGDFVGGIAVLVTLVYLAVQVRQNTAALKTASRQEVVAGYREFNRLQLMTGRSDEYARGLRHYPDLPFGDRSAFSGIINDLALFMQGAFALHESGALEDETYHAYLDWFACNLATPGGAAWWREIGPFFAPRMVAAVDARLARGDLPDITKLPSFALEDEDPSHT